MDHKLEKCMEGMHERTQCDQISPLILTNSFIHGIIRPKPQLWPSASSQKTNLKEFHHSTFQKPREGHEVQPQTEHHLPNMLNGGSI